MISNMSDMVEYGVRYTKEQVKINLRYAMISASCILGILMFTYFCHKKLQRFYYENCNADIIQVLFFQNSEFCIILHGVIRMIEGNYMDLLRTLVGKILW